jgi:hypothetical protein
MNNPTPRANNTPISLGDVVRGGDAGRPMLVVDLNANASMVTVSWKDARGTVFETTLKRAMLTVLKRPKARP